MRRLIAAVAVTTLVIGTVAPVAHAGGHNDAARALASFAAFHHVMFSAFVAPLLFPPPVVVVRPEVVYRPSASGGAATGCRVRAAGAARVPGSRAVPARAVRAGVPGPSVRMGPGGTATSTAVRAITRTRG